MIRPIHHGIARALALACFLLLATACGQKGPLVLPADDSSDSGRGVLQDNARTKEPLTDRDSSTADAALPAEQQARPSADAAQQPSTTPATIE
jgi:predicted small lipoprotein YifL